MSEILVPSGWHGAHWVRTAAQKKKQLASSDRLSASAKSLQQRDTHAAGASSMSQRRRDVCADLEGDSLYGAHQNGSRGRAHSATPDYHARYAANAIGTSLPSARAPEPSAVPLSARQTPASPLTASNRSLATCRYHYFEEAPRGTAGLKPKSYNFSSSSLPNTSAAVRQGEAGVRQGPSTPRSRPCWDTLGPLSSARGGGGNPNRSTFR